MSQLLRIASPGLLWLLGASAQAQDVAVDCDRPCLQRMLDKYLTAVFEHDPAAAQLSDDHFATEDTVVIRNGDGFWKNVSGVGAAQGRYFDPVNGTAAFLGLLKQNGQDTITSVRIRVVSHRVSEAEWITGKLGMGGNGKDDPQGLVKFPPPHDLLPPAQRSSRFLMIALANNYFQANKDHDASWLPNDPECTRVENGVGQRPATQAAPGQGGVGLGPGCLSGFAGMDKFTTDIALRRFTVIDEEAGMVLGTGIYVRYAGTDRRDNLVSEYFQIRGGKIHGIWSAMHFLPPGAPVVTGWEQRHGIWNAAGSALTPTTPTTEPAVALITGSDRGIGFALTQELVARGWKVIATCRDPKHAQALQAFAATHSSVAIETLDVSSASQIDALALKYRGQPIDALINNAGVGIVSLPRAGELDGEEFQRYMLVNAYGPLRVSGAFLEQVAASKQRKIIAITSAISSIYQAPQATLAYSYVVSKAALNMGMRLLQNEVRNRGVIVGVVTPGPVDTDMRRTAEAVAAKAGGGLATPTPMTQLAPTDSARTLVNYIETLGPEKAGRFYTYSGQEVPW